MHAPAPVYVGGPRGSPKPTWRWCWYSGAKSWADLVVWAYRPPMGVYRTALVPVLSHAHGRGWRRTFCPCKQEVISGTLKDTVLYSTLCAVRSMQRDLSSEFSLRLPPDSRRQSSRVRELYHLPTTVVGSCQFGSVRRLQCTGSPYTDRMYRLAQEGERESRPAD